MIDTLNDHLHNARKALRWRVVGWVSRHYETRTCWADIVGWAVYPEDHAFLEVFDLIHDGEPPMCTRDAEQNGSCYCGRIRRERKP